MQKYLDNLTSGCVTAILSGPYEPAVPHEKQIGALLEVRFFYTQSALTKAKDFWSIFSL